jgi:hypothetical protein
MAPSLLSVCTSSTGNVTRVSYFKYMSLTPFVAKDIGRFLKEFSGKSLWKPRIIEECNTTFEGHCLVSRILWKR